MAEQRERLLVQRYIQARYPRNRVMFNAPLGSVHQSLIAEYGRLRALKVGLKTRPMIDAIVFDRKSLLLIEAKIVRWVDGLSKLPLYNAMIPDTPELEQYQEWERHMVLVIPFIQDNMLRIAKRLGVEVVEFTTSEIEDYLQNVLPKYQTAEYKRERAEKLELHRKLGVE